ncbi:MAG: GGDEF domain-containing protein [Candidatus Omnitrophota bacterium]
MLRLIALALLTVFSYFSLKKVLNKSLTDKKNNYNCLEREYENGVRENLRLKTENSVLEKSVEDTIALYDITKEIRRTLDEGEIFKIFKEHLRKYIQAGDALLLKADADLTKYKDHILFPLVIENDIIGYLASSGIQPQDKDKFHILAQQFLAGVRGALLFKKVQGLTIIDNLTQVFNRRYFLKRFSEELERSKRLGYKLSFLMIDTDYFKDFNDKYGHLVGDAILRDISKTIKETIRQVDFMGRYGGEELSVVLTETDKGPARLAAERIRQAIASKHFTVYDEDLRVTISIGISTFPEDTGDAMALIDKADKALYQAKQSGRNRVCVYES